MMSDTPIWEPTPQEIRDLEDVLDSFSIPYQKDVTRLSAGVRINLSSVPSISEFAAALDEIGIDATYSAASGWKFYGQEPPITEQDRENFERSLP